MGDKKTGDGKPRFDLMPWDNMVEVARVFEHGAENYSPHNYREQKDPDMYFAATMRHLLAHQNGERLDPDSGQRHLAHAVASLLIMMGILGLHDSSQCPRRQPKPAEPRVDIHHVGCGCDSCQVEAHREYLRKHPDMAREDCHCPDCDPNTPAFPSKVGDSIRWHDGSFGTITNIRDDGVMDVDLENGRTGEIKRGAEDPVVENVPTWGI